MNYPIWSNLVPKKGPMYWKILRPRHPDAFTLGTPCEFCLQALLLVQCQGAPVLTGRASRRFPWGSSNSLNLSPIKQRKKSNPIHLNGCRIHPAGFNQQFEFADQSIKSSLGHTSMGAWFQSISDNWGMISLYRNLYKVANRIERIQSKIRETISKKYKTSRKRCATDIITFMAFQNCLKKDIAEKNMGEGGQSIQGTFRCYPIVCPSLSVIRYSKTLLLLNRHHKE